jgi:hypothetical protein
MYSEMTIPARSIGLAVLLICLLWSNTYPSTGKVQTYVSKGSMISSLKVERLKPLFAQQTEDTIKVHTLDSLTLKDPNYAIFVALVPGAVVHGAGHFYSGNIGTGLILLASEAVGAGFIAWGAATGVERGEPTGEGMVYVAIGSTLFFGSWAYDLVFAPLGIKKKNEELLRERNTELKFRIRDGDVRIDMVWRF